MGYEVLEPNCLETGPMYNSVSGSLKLSFANLGQIGLGLLFSEEEDAHLIVKLKEWNRQYEAIYISNY